MIESIIDFATSLSPRDAFIAGMVVGVLLEESARAILKKRFGIVLPPVGPHIKELIPPSDSETEQEDDTDE